MLSIKNSERLQWSIFDDGIGGDSDTTNNRGCIVWLSGGDGGQSEGQLKTTRLALAAVSPFLASILSSIPVCLESVVIIPGQSHQSIAQLLSFLRDGHSLVCGHAQRAELRALIDALRIAASVDCSGGGDDLSSSAVPSSFRGGDENSFSVEDYLSTELGQATSDSFPPQNGSTAIAANRAVPFKECGDCVSSDSRATTSGGGGGLQSDGTFFKESPSKFSGYYVPPANAVELERQWFGGGGGGGGGVGGGQNGQQSFHQRHPSAPYRRSFTDINSSRAAAAIDRRNSDAGEYIRTKSLTPILNDGGNADGDVAEVHACSYCDKCFSSAEPLARHIKHSHTQGIFKCDQCNYSSNLRGNVKIHVQSVHLRTKNFACNFSGCTKAFSTKQNLDVHIRCVHMKIKPFSCRFCGFHAKATLNNHVRKHTGEKPFCCNQCGKSFAQQNHLNVHFASTHRTEQTYVTQRSWCGDDSNSNSFVVT